MNVETPRVEAHANPAPTPKYKKMAPVLRALIESGFIIFLFYSNLMMGEFTHSNQRPGKTLLVAFRDVFTATNFAIAVVAALIGYSIVEALRRKV